MNPFIQRISSGLLLIVFLLYITPKEVYHVFTHHTDTTHEILTDNGGLHISNEHHHCDLLKIDQQYHAFDIQKTPFDFCVKQQYFIITNSSINDEFYSLSFQSTKQLRAPPSC